jgi:hypothetical protein
MSDWKQILAGSFSGDDQSPAPLLVEIEAPDEHARLSVKGEGLAFLNGSEGAEPDLAIRLSDHSLEDVLLRQADAVAAFRDAEVSAGAGWTAPLPAAEVGLLADAEFEAIPGASLVAVLVVTSTMFGDVCLVERWEDGALVASEIAAPSRLDDIGAELRLTCTLSQITALRRREITPSDALAAGARLQTDWPYMACFFGLIRHPAYADAYATAPAVDAQIAWGQVLSSPAYDEAVTQAQSTSPTAA